MTANTTIPRYSPTYRKDEINLALTLALRGESMGFVGIAGVGKSNIVNFLRNIQRNAQYVEQNVEKLHFPIVDATIWEGSPNSLWQMMLAALEQATASLNASLPAGKVGSISEDEQVLNALQTKLQWICGELKHQVMFVLDDFDAVLEGGSLAMLEQLNGFRSAGNRGYLSYLVFTKRLPHLLGRNHNLGQKSKFYDLFRHNIYALPPYSTEDARRMLKHLNDMANSPLSTKELIQIHALAGGHARLQKVLFETWIKEGQPNEDSVAYFLSKPAIQTECERILLNLHAGEKEAALQMVQNSKAPNNSDILDHLMRRGLLVESKIWFSPLFGKYLSMYKA